MRAVVALTYAALVLMVAVLIWIPFGIIRPLQRDPNEACQKCRSWLQLTKSGSMKCPNCDSVKDEEWHDLRWLNLH